MLSNLDIERIAEKADLPIVGVFSKDKIPKKHQIGSYYINLQNFNDGDGSHWCLMKIYRDHERDKTKALWFDPFGLDMPREIENYLEKYKPIPYSNRQIQGINQTECGWYCLACDWSLENGRGENETILDHFEKFLALWSDQPALNLKYLKALFKPL
jgi:hypothetical protein